MRLLTLPVTAAGQLRQGDQINLLDKEGATKATEVKEVLNAGTDKEEIIICLRKNLYFITSNYLRGTSWVKECVKVTSGRTDT